MTVSAAYEQTALSVSTTELSLISGTSTLQNNTTAGWYCLVIDCSNMAKGDEFLVKIKEKTRSGGTQRVVDQFPLQDTYGTLQYFAPVPLLNGWDMTIIKVAGTDRAFDTSIRKSG